MKNDKDAKVASAECCKPPIPFKVDNENSTLLEELKSSIEKEKEKSEGYKTLLQRVQADFENYVKRSDAERRELAMNGCDDLVVKLVDVADTMDLALNAKPNSEEGKKMLDGFRRVNNQLRSTLQTEGLEEIGAEGVFNHDLHEAVGTVEDNGKPNGTIVEVVQRGYKLKGNLIRTSKVVVVKNRGDANG
jgi:molecular chaperone GrpE